jgi:23S rRNA (uracil1939-C5)-methyltransferase
MSEPAAVELQIEKMIYGGDGLARLRQPDESRAQTVFLPFVLARERVEATAIEEKPGLWRGELQKVLTASAHRVEPHCPYFGACGGCHYQHADYGHQLEIKEAILREALERIGKLRWQNEIQAHGSPEWNYRNRTRMKLRARPFALGYYRFKSRELLAVEVCPISSPLINRAVAMLWELGRQQQVPAGIVEIEFFANAEDSVLLIELREDTRQPADQAAIATFAEQFRTALPEIAGIAIFSGRENAPPKLRRLSKELQQKLGKSELCYRTVRGEYRVGAGAFFQINRFMTDRLLEIVTGRSGKRALDLYAGTGLFAAELARKFHSVVAVESDDIAFGDLRHNLPANARAQHATAEQYVDGLKTGKNSNFDLIVVDPPRAGLGKRLAQKLANLAARELTYVSCDPATLARDLAVLIANGYQLRELHLVDLFPQTYHLETVAHLAR